MTNKQALKPGKYAVLFRNNCDGEGDTYETLAILDEGLVWRDEYGDELFEFQGDAVLKAWPLDDGSNVLALLDELEAKDRRLSEITAPNMLLPAIDDLDENQLRQVIKTCSENYSLLHSKWEAAKKRVADQQETLNAARSYVKSHAAGDGHAFGVFGLSTAPLAASTGRGDMAKVILHNTDCFDIFPTMADGSVDLVCADIPYGTMQCRWDSVLDLSQMWEQLYRIAKPKTAIVLFSAQPFTSVLIASNLRDWRSEWIWEKGNATGFLNAKKQPLRAHEYIEVFYRRQPTYNPQMTEGDTRKTSKRKTVNSECYAKALTLTKYDSTKRYTRDVQFFSSDKQTENFHPTQKPLALVKYIIET